MPLNPVQRLFVGQDLTAAADSATFNFQRLSDEDGAWQIQVNQEPDGGALAGTIELRGRLRPELEWALLDSINITDLAAAAAYPYTVIRTLVGKVTPQMRCSIVAPVAVAASTELDVAVMP